MQVSTRRRLVQFSVGWLSKSKCAGKLERERARARDRERQRERVNCARWSKWHRDRDRARNRDRDSDRDRDRDGDRDTAALGGASACESLNKRMATNFHSIREWVLIFAQQGNGY